MNNWQDRSIENCLERLHNITCTILNVSYIDTMRRKRDRKFVEARQITMFIVMKYQDILKLKHPPSLASTGIFFSCYQNPNGYDHATVLSACKTVQKMIDTKALTEARISFSDAINTIIDKFTHEQNTIDGFPFDLKTNKRAVEWALTGR